MAGDTTAMGPTEGRRRGLDGLLAPLREDSGALGDPHGRRRDDRADRRSTPRDASVPERDDGSCCASLADALRPRRLPERPASTGRAPGRRSWIELAYSGNHGFELLLPGDERGAPGSVTRRPRERRPPLRRRTRSLRARAGRDQDRGQGRDRRACTGVAPRTRERRSPLAHEIASEAEWQGLIAAPRPQGARDPAERPDQQGDRGGRPHSRVARRRCGPLRRRRSHRRRRVHRTADAARGRAAPGHRLHRGRLRRIPTGGLDARPTPRFDGPEGFVRVLEALAE